MPNDKEVLVDENGNRLKVDAQKGYIEQEMHFTDENGNRLKFSLQSQQWTTGEPGLNAGGRFDGYTVYPFNNDPDIEVHDAASAAARDAAYEKIFRDAEKYFDMHPEARPKDGYSRKIAYITTYANIQAGGEMRRRAAEGKASSLEKAYVYQLDNLKKTSFFCWEQLLGKMPLDAAAEENLAAIRRDKLTETMKQQEKDYKRSVERGTESIKNRVAEAQNIRYDIRRRNREVPNAEEALRKKKAQDKTLSLDEVNAVIHNKVEKMR